jgi:hypothetical protein
MDAQAGADAQAAVPARRAARSPRDIALSMGVLLVPVIVLLILYNVLFNGDHPRAIDPSDTLETARHSAAFTVSEPRGLPGGWAVVSSTYQKQGDGSVLRLGYVTPHSGGLQLVESDRPVNTLLPDELGADAQPGQLVPIGANRWREYPTAKGGDRALVLADSGRTVIVIGTGSDDDLRLLAGSLR